MSQGQSCSGKKSGSIGDHGQTPEQVVLEILPFSPCEQIYKVTLVSGYPLLVKSTLGRTGFLSLDPENDKVEFWTLKMVTRENIKASEGLRATMTQYVQDVEDDKQKGEDARCFAWEGPDIQNAGGLFITLRSEADPKLHATFRVEGPG